MLDVGYWKLRDEVFCTYFDINVSERGGGGYRAIGAVAVAVAFRGICGGSYLIWHD